MKGTTAYALANGYTNDSISGAGALAGSPCTIKSITKSGKDNTVTFEWTKTDGTTTTSQMVVTDGADPNEISSIVIDSTDNHVKVTMADGTVLDAGKMPQEPIAISKDSGNAISLKSDGLFVSSTGVQISAETTNAIETKADGLYVKKVTVDNAISSTSENPLQNKVVKSELDKKVDVAQGVANKGKSLIVGTDGNVTLGNAQIDIATSFGTTTSDAKVPSEKLVKTELDKKLDSNKVVSTFSATTLDTNVASEKLVKTEIDKKVDSTKIVSTFSTTTLDTNIPSEKLVKDNLDKKIDVSQGVINKGKALIVGEDGNVTCGTVATDSLTIVDKTQAEYNALTDAEKNDATKLYNITDADDLDLTSYAKQSDVDAINNNLGNLFKYETIRQSITVAGNSKSNNTEFAPNTPSGYSIHSISVYSEHQALIANYATVSGKYNFFVENIASTERTGNCVARIVYIKNL